jgi:hypothetical protein
VASTMPGMESQTLASPDGPVEPTGDGGEGRPA